MLETASAMCRLKCERWTDKRHRRHANKISDILALASGKLDRVVASERRRRRRRRRRWGQFYHEFTLADFEQCSVKEEAFCWAFLWLCLQIILPSFLPSRGGDSVGGALSLLIYRYFKVSWRSRVFLKINIRHRCSEYIALYLRTSQRDFSMFSKDPPLAACCTLNGWLIWRRSFKSTVASF